MALIWIYLFPLLFASSGNTNYSLTINIQHITSSEGKLRVAVYNQEKDFMGTDHAFRNLSIDVAEGNKTVVVEDIPAGTYAVAVFHDRNNNNELDKNFLGAPSEPYGFSNNARGKFGPPKYKNCLVKVNRNITISIRIK